MSYIDHPVVAKCVTASGMLKILIAEDDFMIADAAEEVLLGWGYEVCGIARTVADGVALGLIGVLEVLWQGFAFMGGLIVIGLLIYYIARFSQASKGINLDLIYQELPPE